MRLPVVCLLTLYGCSAHDASRTDGAGLGDAMVPRDAATARDLAAMEVADLANPEDLVPSDIGPLPDHSEDPWIASKCPGWSLMPDVLFYTRNFKTMIVLQLKNGTGRAGAITGIRFSGLDVTHFALRAPGIAPLDVAAGGTIAFDTFLNARKDGSLTANLELMLGDGCTIVVTMRTL